ncbi:hypothetical protein TetV_337 [Tetraselmis virus 1]|uniref:Uncharacterized protein n=1 Tax=Tetraselmis virus 1 TaxID=2060617 RepID=A0A2P0VNV4_9VIRU|nr:hypothetical protein QJ968_gp337 [Tetraselmis virus 1]AUF82429.1 hypothetical protein TetV_337 [Tetraselmis virus 1]
MASDKGKPVKTTVHQKKAAPSAKKPVKATVHQKKAAPSAKKPVKAAPSAKKRNPVGGNIASLPMVSFDSGYSDFMITTPKGISSGH